MRRPQSRLLAACVAAAFLLAFFAALHTQRGSGLADNGDFIRGTSLFTPGPVGFDSNWSQATTQDNARRFFNYWIPDWKEDWRVTRPPSSAILLWLPGLIVDHFITPAGIHLPTLSWVHKLLLLGLLLGVVVGIMNAPAGFAPRLLFVVTLGVPLFLVFTTADYTAYFSSFFQESAVPVCLSLFAGSLVLLKLRPGGAPFWISMLALALLATTKRSALYWPLIAVPALFYARFGAGAFTRKRIAAVILALGGLTLFAAAVTSANAHPANKYHSLYYGILPFSREPDRHLDRLGLAGTRSCVNVIAYKPKGQACFDKTESNLSFAKTVDVFFHEPSAGFRMGAFVLNSMQDVSLDYLGKFTEGDPRSPAHPTPVGDFDPSLETRVFNPTGIWNAWSSFKFRFFPVGIPLAVTLAVFLGWFAFATRRPGIVGALSLAGLTLTLACTADMAVAIAGDGKFELIKHLLLANFAFDLALIAFVNSVLVSGYLSIFPANPKASSPSVL